MRWVAGLAAVLGCSSAPPPHDLPPVLVAPNPTATPAPPPDAPPAPVQLTVHRDKPSKARDGVRVALRQAMRSADASDVPTHYAELILSRREGDDERTGELVLGPTGEAPTTRTGCGLRFSLVEVAPMEQQVMLTVGGRFALAPVQRIEKDKRITIAPGVDITFTHHGHKRTMVDGPPSPLLVSYTRHLATGDVEESMSLQTYETRDFEIGSYTFELVDHAYGASMTVRLISTP